MAFTAQLTAAPVAGRPETRTQSGDVHTLRGAARRLSLSGIFAFGSGKLGGVAGTARVRTRAPRALPASCAALRA